MKKNIILILAITALISACNKQKEVFNYNQAQILPDEPKTLIVPIAKPVYIKDQLKKPTNKKRNKNTNHLKIVKDANKQSTQQPVEEGMINSMMVYDYMPGALYQVYTSPLRLTTIMLQPGEELISAAAGDTARWMLSPTIGGTENGVSQTHLLIKPTRSRLKTNLFITTSKRTYNLEMSSYDEGYMASIKWNYPREDMKAMQYNLQQQQKNDEEVISTAISLNDLNFNYKIKSNKWFGKPKWTPVRVYDDGRKTFIQFPKTVKYNQLPILFIESISGETQIVNYRKKGEYFIIDRIFDRAQLRMGTKKQQVVYITRRS